MKLIKKIEIMHKEYASCEKKGMMVCEKCFGIYHDNFYCTCYADNKKAKKIRKFWKAALTLFGKSAYSEAKHRIAMLVD